MYQYFVTTYAMKSGFFGTNVEKEDKRLTDYLNLMNSTGWELVSMSEMNSDDRSFVYKLVFRAKKV